MLTNRAATAKALLTSPPKTGLATLSLIAFAVFIALMPWRVSAQQESHHVFTGSVLVGGHAAQDGSILTAWIGGRRVGVADVLRESRYKMVIPPQANISFAGKKVSFLLDGEQFHWAGTWKAGGITELDLTFARSESFMPSGVSAQQRPSHVFSGSVVVGDGAARNGSIVTAWISGRRVGVVEVRQGRFRMVIPRREDMAFTGKEVSFWLDARRLHGTGIWRGGGTTDLELTITRAEYLGGQVGQSPTSPSVSDGNSSPATDLSFVGVEPAVCETLGIDGGVLRGAMLRLGGVDKRDGVRSNGSEIKATLNQIGCRLVGEWKIASPSLNGSGLFQGTVDGNFVRFTVLGETKDAAGNMNFSGIYKGSHISGQYFSSRTMVSGEWILGTRRHAAGVLADWARSIEKSSPGALSEFTYQWEVQAAEENQSLFQNRDRADSARFPQAVQPTPAAPANAEKQAPPSNTVSEPAKPAPTEEKTARILF